MDPLNSTIKIQKLRDCTFCNCPRSAEYRRILLKHSHIYYRMIRFVFILITKFRNDSIHIFEEEKNTKKETKSNWFVGTHCYAK